MSNFCFICFILFVGIQNHETYGLPWTALQLSTVDTDTAKITPIGAAIPHYIGSSPSAIDVNKEIFYTSTRPKEGSNWPNYTNLVGLSLKDGSVKHLVALPFEASEYTPQAIDPVTGDVFCAGFIGDPGIYNLTMIYRVDPTTKKISLIANRTSKPGKNNLGMMSAYDPSENIYYLEMLVEGPLGYHSYIFGYNVDTGNLVVQQSKFAVVRTFSNIYVRLGNTVQLSTMDYDVSSQKIWGIGQKKQSLWGKTKVMLFTIDKSSPLNFFHQEVVVEGDWQVDGDGGYTSALDHKNQLYYTFLQKYGSHGGSLDPFYLLNIDMATGSLAQTSPSCKYPGTCPLSIKL